MQNDKTPAEINSLIEYINWVIGLREEFSNNEDTKIELLFRGHSEIIDTVQPGVYRKNKE